MNAISDALHWRVHTTVEKWHDPDDHAAGHPPDEVVEVEGNALLNAGITRLLSLLTGAGGQAFDTTHARVGVGDSTTAVAPGQTDLQATTNKRWAVMEAGFPNVSGQTVTFKGQFETGEANFAWEEFGIDAGTADGTTVSAPMLNRKVTSIGTKASGIWTLTIAITIS